MRANNGGNDVTGELTSDGTIVEHARRKKFASLSPWVKDAVMHFFPKDSTSLNGWDHVAVKRDGREIYLTELRSESEIARRVKERKQVARRTTVASSALSSASAPVPTTTTKTTNDEKHAHASMNTEESTDEDDDQTIEPPTSKPRVAAPSSYRFAPSTFAMPFSSSSSSSSASAAAAAATAQRPRLSRADRNKLWENWMGNVMYGPCPICERQQIHSKDPWHAGHINAWSRSRDMRLHILMPMCQGCNNNSQSTQNVFDLIWSCERTDRHERDLKIIDFVRRSKHMFQRESTRADKEHWKPQGLEVYARFAFGDQSRGGIETQEIYEVLSNYEQRRFHLVVLRHGRNRENKLIESAKKRIASLEKLISSAKNELETHRQEFTRYDDAFKDTVMTFKNDFNTDFGKDEDIVLSNVDDST